MFMMHIKSMISQIQKRMVNILFCIFPFTRIPLYKPFTQQAIAQIPQSVSDKPSPNTQRKYVRNAAITPVYISKRTLFSKNITSFLYYVFDYYIFIAICQ